MPTTPENKEPSSKNQSILRDVPRDAAWGALWCGGIELLFGAMSKSKKGLAMQTVKWAGIGAAFNVAVGIAIHALFDRKSASHVEKLQFQRAQLDDQTLQR